MRRKWSEVENSGTSLQLAGKRQKDFLVWAAAAAVVALAGYLRLVNLRQSPGWYSDEGIFISLAQHLAAGQWQLFGVYASPLEIQRPPLFLFALSQLFRFWGADILVLRGLTAACGTLDVLLLFIFARQPFGNRLALLSSGLLAIMPWVVSFNRLGFSYNLMAPFFMLAIFSAWKFTQEDRLYWGILAGLSAALAFCVDYLGVVAIIVVLVVLLLYRRRWLLWGLLLMGVVAAGVILPPVLANFSGSVKDVQFITGTKVAVSPVMQIANLIVNYGELILHDGWVLLAFTGLFLLPHPHLRGIILFGVGLSFLLTIRTFSPAGRGMHYLIHLFPFLALGLAVLVDRAFSKARAVFEEMFAEARSQLPWVSSSRLKRRTWNFFQRLAVVLLLLVVLVNPFLWMFFTDLAESVYGVNYLFAEGNDLGLVSSSDAAEARIFLKEKASEGDLVLASQQVLWTLDGLHQTDWGITADYDSGVGVPGRYEYSCASSQVKFAVIDPLARGFVKKLDPRMKKIVDEAESWPLVFRSGELEIRQNPQIP